MHDIVYRSGKLLRRIHQLTPKDATTFSTPSHGLISLPFPAVYRSLPERFTMSGNEEWNYIPREKFQDLLTGVLELIATPRAGLWLFGTIGYGKSHLLAALVCYLSVTGYRVVYIPDCRACLENPFGYVQAAMALCWAGSPSLLAEIMALKTRDDISRFFARQPAGVKPIIFVIDQMNALEPASPASAESARNGEKIGLESWLKECSSWHKRVYSSSANYTSYLESLKKQMNLIRVNAFGGLTPVRIMITQCLYTCLYCLRASCDIGGNATITSTVPAIPKTRSKI